MSITGTNLSALLFFSLGLRTEKQVSVSVSWGISVECHSRLAYPIFSLWAVRSLPLKCAQKPLCLQCCFLLAIILFSLFLSSVWSQDYSQGNVLRYKLKHWTPLLYTLLEDFMLFGRKKIPSPYQSSLPFWSHVRLTRFSLAYLFFSHDSSCR